MYTLKLHSCGLQAASFGRLQRYCLHKTLYRPQLTQLSARRRQCTTAAAAEVSQSTAAGAAAGSEGFQEAIFPKLTDSSQEQEWVANAVQVWLDQEWTPLEAHKDLGQAAGQAYIAARESGKHEAGDVLLVLTDRLSKADFKDTFVDQFTVSNKVIELLMLHHDMDVSCYRKEDRKQYEQIEKEVS